jgi:hypothetical protein
MRAATAAACSTAVRVRWSTCVSLPPSRWLHPTCPHIVNHCRLIHSHLPRFSSPSNATSAATVSSSVPPPPSSPSSSSLSYSSPEPRSASPSISCPPSPPSSAAATSPTAATPRPNAPIALPSAETFRTSLQYCLDYVKSAAHHHRHTGRQG